ncbi:MAG: hypothetical protein WC023_12960 [Rhodocyclaceae bacterium]
MKIVVWSLCLVFSTLWTGLAFLAAEAMQWIANGLASGQISDPMRSVAQWPVPAWMSAWIDPVWVEVLRSMLASGLTMMGEVIPFFSSAVSWVVPLIWVLWVVGVLVLLALAGAAHLLIRIFQTPRRAPAFPDAIRLPPAA